MLRNQQTTLLNACKNRNTIFVLNIYSYLFLSISKNIEFDHFGGEKFIKGSPKTIKKHSLNALSKQNSFYSVFVERYYMYYLLVIRYALHITIIQIDLEFCNGRNAIISIISF